jgi:beta-galactosidase/beta-glucuronidase
MTLEIKIIVGDVTDIEAHVYACYPAPDSRIKLKGALRGPYCEKARTLPAEYRFRESANENVVEALAIVPDPCLWTSEMPHIYNVDVEALSGDKVVAEYHGTIGLRRLSPRRPVDFAPGTG